MNKTSNLLCAHSALLLAALMGIGVFGITGWLPPVDPGRTAEDIARMFVEDKTRIRIGVSILAFASVFWWSFSAAIAMQMRRIEGDRNHPLSYVQIGCAAGTVLAILIPSYLWLAMAYRADTLQPDALQLINDFCWLSFIGMYPPGLIQNLSLALVIFSDSNKKKQIYPRWVGYLNIWFAIGFMPGGLLAFFHSGPFTWRGVIGFWLVAALFFGWIVVMWTMTVRAIKAQPEIEEA